MEAEPQERVAQLERPEGTNPPDDRRLDNSYRLDIKSIESLWPGEWLDDGVINAFLRSLCLTRPGEYVTFDGAALNFLLSVLESEGATAPTQTEVDELYKPFRALAATVTGNRGLVFMPFCLGSHWILAVADLQTQIIRVYDSLVSWDRTSQVVPSRLVEQILPYVKGTLRFCSDEDGWAVEHIRLPIETNSTECGVYLCLMALHETHRPETGLGGYVTLFYDENGVLSSYKLDSCYWIAGRKVILEVCRRLFIPTSGEILQRFRDVELAINEDLREHFYNVPIPRSLPWLWSYLDARRWTLGRVTDALSVTIESIDGLGSTQYLPRNEYIQRRAREVVLTPQGEPFRDQIADEATSYAWHDVEALQNLREGLIHVRDRLIGEDSGAQLRRQMEEVERTEQTPVVTAPGSPSSPGNNDSAGAWGLQSQSRS